MQHRDLYNNNMKLDRLIYESDYISDKRSWWDIVIYTIHGGTPRRKFR